MVYWACLQPPVMSNMKLCQHERVNVLATLSFSFSLSLFFLFSPTFPGGFSWARVVSFFPLLFFSSLPYWESQVKLTTEFFFVEESMTEMKISKEVCGVCNNMLTRA